MTSTDAWRTHSFNAQGIDGVRQCFGIMPAVYREFEGRFKAAELAWLITGASEDASHFEEFNGMHPLFAKATKGLTFGDGSGQLTQKTIKEQLRKLLFDIATILDRAFGTGTMIMHMNGTLAPSVPIRREYMKCVVYLPPLVVKASHSEEHCRMMNIAQEFLDVIGTRVVTRYQAAIQKKQWHYRSGWNGTRISPNARQKTLPMPSRSASITILGQESDDLDGRSTTVITAPMTPSSSSSTTHPDSTIMSLHLEVSQLRASLRAAYDEIERLKAIASASERLQHHTITSGSHDVLSTPRRHHHIAPGSPDVSMMPRSNHHIALSSPSTSLPRRQWHVDDAQLPAYSDPMLDVPDIVTKYNLTRYVDDIMNTMEHVEGRNWKCVLEALDVDVDVVDELVDAMGRAKLN